MKIVNIKEVKTNPKNPRVIKDDKFKKLVKSIQEFPDMLNKRPLVCFTDTDGKYVVLGGNMRLKACNELKLTEIPIILADEWTEEQKNEFLIKDNVGFGEWDWDDLANEWDVEKLEEWGLDIPNFDNAVHLEAEEDDFDGTPPEEPKTVLGDLYEIGEHRLLCGDSTDSDIVAKLMNGQKADMVFTDPPYGVDYEGINNDNRSGLKELLNGAFSNYITNSKNGASVYCFHSDKCSDIFNEVFRSYCHFSSMVIWVKESIVLSQTDYQSKHEPCFYGWFDNGTHKWYSDRKQESIWIAKSKREEGHTTPKPIEIVSKGINNSSQTNHLVLDLFLGSGSTMVASHQLKRKCYGMELDPKYCDVIIKRMIKLDDTLTIKRNGVDVTNEWK
ncbi:COG0863 DNA modification methylase [uncultured Caudovirales phage]|uniref:COG0863 DNA modification methylase n=1 Tax=uncultured Caudovirales phage TaxID=2100421 RepID=A0A6J5N3Y3_9CAUD|nr:COG0863 DNA modification methylase [uncultured Caudovirales phage]